MSDFIFWSQIEESARDAPIHHLNPLTACSIFPAKLKTYTF